MFERLSPLLSGKKGVRVGVARPPSRGTSNATHTHNSRPAAVNQGARCSFLLCGYARARPFRVNVKEVPILAIVAGPSANLFAARVYRVFVTSALY